ncbi:FGGY-family carbohydrate kinase [Streptomyces qinzhouensis]|uniref:Carbohydrate kinase n=1 Tax=Streptomyces qinzhouensis TaxID=2599401 RepID=A0A5B8JKP8_9ACTN|nr:FGGY family carbohydrate kinase [Streptomyces qinzhouensis]QDY80481.1 carbohydrate kinase [Streptomyces qinzhouensis]
MSSRPVVIGVDVATAAVRALCVDGQGRVRGEAREPLPEPVRGPGGTSEQDARAWWPAVCAALRRITAGLPSYGREVVAVAVSATSGTIVPADADGGPLGPALMYDDRSAADINAAAQRLGAARWDALGLTVGPTAALGRAVRCLHTHGPALRQVLHTPEVIGRALTGGPVPADWSHALKTGYDPRAGHWAEEVFTALGFPLTLLPRVGAPGTEAGTVGPAAAEATGLPVGCSVRLGMTDGCAGQLATGAVAPGQFVGVLGTTYVLKGVSTELVRDPAGALYSHRHPDGWWLPGGASNTGGEALGPLPAPRIAALDRAARERGPASYIRYPLRREGERFPFVAPAARGFALGGPADETDAHRAALEGVAFVERLAVERVRRLGIPVSGPLYAAGGGSRSPVWSAIRATVLDRPVRAAERAETAFGAALLAASGTLHASLAESAAAMTGRRGTAAETDPVPAERAALEDAYGRFVTELRRRGWLDGG